ncbi:MAG: hypothetical protein MOGMAGMI_00412 [Candidatus Omnitrophica bacterium]|nr:hypothetical protein [Candidatus Omnitrophota bacterium]
MAKETVHIYLDEAALKIAKVRPSGAKKVVSGLYFRNLLGIPEEQVGRELRQGLAALGYKSGPVSILLPSKYVITKNIEVPSLDPKEIGDIVKLQAVRHTPYSKEEVTVSHINIDVVLERYTKALLVLSANDNIRKRTALLQQSGHDTEAVHLAAETVTRGAAALLGVGGEGAPVGMLFLDANGTDLLVSHKGKPAFMRSIPVGVVQLKQDPENLKLLTEEIKKTCESYQGEDQGTLPVRFVVFGAAAPQKEDVAKAFREGMNIACDVVPQDAAVTLLPEARKVLEQNPQAAFFDVIADGCLPSATSVDLTPEDLRIRKAFKAKGYEIFMAGTFLMVILILTMSIFLTKIYFRNRYLREIKVTFEIKKKEAEDLMRISEEAKVVRQFNTAKALPLAALNELQRILPEDMYLNEITMTSDDRIVIKGTSDLMSSVFAFVTAFENNAFFQNVTADYTKSRKEGDKDVSDFGISATLESSPLPQAARARSTEKEVDPEEAHVETSMESRTKTIMGQKIDV